MKSSDVKAKILEIVNQKHKSSGGKCGTPFVFFCNELKISGPDFEDLITEMYNDELIDIRTGINGFMVMKKIK